MQKYYKIDVIKFIKDYSNWTNEIARLKDSPKKVNTNQIGMDIPKELYPEEEMEYEPEVIDRINQLKRFIVLRKNCFNCVTQRELDAVEAFFGNLRPMDKEDTAQQEYFNFMGEKYYLHKEALVNSVQEFLDKHNLVEISYVYVLKNKAIKRMRSYLSSHEMYDELKDYYFFDIAECLKDAGKWSRELHEKNLQIEYDIGIKSPKIDTVGGGRAQGGINDTVGNAVVANERLAADVRRLQSKIQVIKDALSVLDDEEYEIITTKCFPKGRDRYKKQEILTQQLANKMFISASGVERRFKRGKDKMKHYIETTYFGR